MIKYGCVALVAIACSAVVPAAKAQGNFFVAGQVGQAKYDDSGFDDASANTRAISVGYRWQAGPIAQVGIEAGAGTVDEISQETEYFGAGGYSSSSRAGIEADYRHIGANARFNFGEGSRWFAIARGGYMAYEMDGSAYYEATYNDVPYYSETESIGEDGGGAYFGAGIGVDITPNFNVNVMYNSYAYSDFEGGDYSTDDIGTASTTTLGIEVRF